MITHILFPTDFSSQSARALEYVCHLAKTYQAQVTVIYAYDLPKIRDKYKQTFQLFDDFRKYVEEYSEGLLADVKKKLEMQDISVEIYQLEGYPGEAIVDACEEKGCDLIVMGTRGLGGVSGFLLGSISNYVIHHAHKPVLLIPESDEE